MNEAPLIPKKLHFIWIGNPISDKYIENIKKWRAQNPDYEVNLWIDTSVTPQDKVAEAIEKAGLTGARIRDINSKPDKEVIDNALNKKFYDEEIVGANANLAAASDILRLEILYHEGGIYLDTDIEPSNGKLGNIIAPEGFVKPPGEGNDVLCAVAKNYLIDRFRNKLKANYEDWYNHPDTALANKVIAFHRSKRPWKARTETTLEWSGPELIMNLLKKHMNQIPDDEGIAKFSRDVFSDDLKKKVIISSDQNWRDKGPKSDIDAKRYFTEEFFYRIKPSVIGEIQKVIENLDKNKIPKKNIEELRNLMHRINNIDDSIPISSVINSWQKRYPESARYIAPLLKKIHEIEKDLNSKDINIKNYEDLRAQFFPKSKFNDESINQNAHNVFVMSPTIDIYLGMNENNQNIKDIKNNLDRMPKVKTNFMQTIRSLFTTNDINNTDQSQRATSINSTTANAPSANKILSSMGVTGTKANEVLHSLETQQLLTAHASENLKGKELLPNILSSVSDEKYALYNDADITTITNLGIDDLGGHVREHHFLLNGKIDNKFPDEDGHLYKVLVTPAIDTQSYAAPIDFYFDKNKQQKPDATYRDDRRDVFDEISPEITKPGESHIKILFPYNITQVHWLTGEIKIHKNNHEYHIELSAHDPFGGGNISTNYSALCATLEKKIKMLDSQASIQFKAVESSYSQRQSHGDNKSCGVIQAEDLLKRVQGETLNRSSPYPVGAETLRAQHCDKVKQKLSAEDDTRNNFLQRQGEQPLAVVVSNRRLAGGL